MADDLSVLLKIRGDSAGAQKAAADTRAAIASLKTTSSADFKAMQSAGSAAHAELKTAASKTAAAHKDLGDALSTVSPRLGGLVSSLSSAVGPLSAVATGLVAIGGAAVALFEVTRGAAEFQGKLFDLSQQTGISVETLSTLEVVAKTTGGSLESIVASLGIFQKHLESAQDPTSKEAKLLKELGVEAGNTEQALRDTLARLAAMPAGFQQTALALELFGRGGKQLLAILKETHGDLDATTDRLRTMGILVTTEASVAADKFNDQLAEVGFQVRGLTAIIGNEAMPAILRAVEQVSDFLKDNRAEFVEWATEVAAAARGAFVFADAVKTLGGQLTGIGNIPIPAIIRLLGSVSGIAGLIDAFKVIGAEAPGPAAYDKDTRMSTSLGSQNPPLIEFKKEEDKEKARREAEQRANRATAQIFRELEDRTRSHRAILERERQLDLKSIDEWAKEATKLAEGYEREQQKVLDREEANARRFTANAADLQLTLNDIALKRNEALRQLLTEREKIEDAAQKRRDQVTLATEKQLASIRDTAREGEIQRLKADLDRQAITESEALARELALLKDTQEQRLLLIQVELDLQTTSADRKTELDNEKINSEQKYTDEVKRLTQERLDAQIKEAQAAGGRTPNESPQPEPLVDLNAPTSAIDQLFKAVNDNLTGDTQTAALAGLEAMSEAFSGLGQAVGQAVQAFVLYGSAGQSVRQVTAQILASVAQQAAVKAIFELAEGFAALALAFFGIPNAGPSAQAHFTAAAIYGTIAAVAAVAGRVVAGDSFSKQSSGGSGGSGGGSSSGAGNRPSSPSAQEIDRRNYAPIVNEIHFRVKGDAVVDSFVRDYDLNGRTRIKILTDGQG